ncbi:hypothetical protein D3C86_1310620 [compost metagenome]
MLLYKEQAFTQMQGFLQALAQTGTAFCIYFQAINNQFYVMYLITVNLHFRLQVYNYTIHTYLQVSLLLQLLKQFSVMPFTATNNRCEQYDLFFRKVIVYML